MSVDVQLVSGEGFAMGSDELKMTVPRRREGEDFDRVTCGTSDLDRMSAVVLDRIRSIPESDVIRDPQGTLFAVAADVERSMPARASTSSDAALQDEARRFFQDCVQALEPQCKEILGLHVNDGLTYKQIAARLGRSTEYVLRHLIRAYCTLRNHRSSHGGSTD